MVSAHCIEGKLVFRSHRACYRPIMTRVMRILAAALFAVACTTGAEVQKGIDAYMKGDLHAAMTRWNELDASRDDMNQKGLVRYLVYRGLTAYELGDKEQARRYLSEGAAAYQRGDSRWLPPNIVDRMQQALGATGDNSSMTSQQ